MPTRICDNLISFANTFLCHISWGCPVIQNDEVKVRIVSSAVLHAPRRRITVSDRLSKSCCNVNGGL